MPTIMRIPSFFAMFWRLQPWAIAVIFISATPALASDSPQDIRTAWLTAALYGNDNDSASLRRVIIEEECGGGYTALIENQFGFLCDLQFGEDGHPEQLSACVSKSKREGLEEDFWFVQQPEVIHLHCAKLPGEFVCRGQYVLASGNFSLGRTEMTIAMPRSALPQAKAEPVSQPTLAYCTATKVNIRTEPSRTSSIAGQIEKGRVVLIGMQETEEGPWYQLDLPDAPGSGWIFADYIAIPDAPMPDLAQIVLQFGNSPAKARALFGEPNSSAQSAAAVGGISEETLFYPSHQAVYKQGLLAGVVLEPDSPLGLGRWKLGQAASSCLVLGEPEKQGDSWTFMISPNDYLRFTIKNDQIAGAEYFTAAD